MKELIPLFSTIAGAAIALVGILVQYKLSSTKDRNALLRSKLDEMGALAEEIVFWTDQDFYSLYTIAARVGELNGSPRREYLQKLNALNYIAKMYHSQLLRDAHRFIRAVKKYDEIKMSFFAKGVENTKFDLQIYKEEVRPKFEQLTQVEKQFLEAISKSMEKLL